MVLMECFTLYSNILMEKKCKPRTLGECIPPPSPKAPNIAYECSDKTKFFEKFHYPGSDQEHQKVKNFLLLVPLLTNPVKYLEESVSNRQTNTRCPKYNIFEVYVFRGFSMYPDVIILSLLMIKYENMCHISHFPVVTFSKQPTAVKLS